MGIIITQLDIAQNLIMIKLQNPAQILSRLNVLNLHSGIVDRPDSSSAESSHCDNPVIILLQQQIYGQIIIKTAIQKILICQFFHLKCGQITAGHDIFRQSTFRYIFHQQFQGLHVGKRKSYHAKIFTPAAQLFFYYIFLNNFSDTFNFNTAVFNNLLCFTQNITEVIPVQVHVKYLFQPFRINLKKFPGLQLFPQPAGPVIITLSNQGSI